METFVELDQLTKSIQDKLNDALKSVTRQDITMSLGQTGIVSTEETHKIAEGFMTATTIYIPIVGEVTGDIFLFLSNNSAVAIADAMLGNAPGQTNVLDELGTSALKELGNITTGVIVTELSNSLSISMMLTIPNIATDLASALVDQVLISYGETSNTLLSMTIPFEISTLGVSGKFLLLFDNSASQLIRSKLNPAEVHG